MITFISSMDGDWEGMYIGDRLVLEGHSLEPKQVAAELMKADVRTQPIQTGGITEQCIEDFCWKMPPRLADVVCTKDFPLETYEP